MNQMFDRLKLLLSTGKGKGDALCNFFVEDQLKQFSRLWSDLLDNLKNKLDWIKRMIYECEGSNFVEEEIK